MSVNDAKKGVLDRLAPPGKRLRTLFMVILLVLCICIYYVTLGIFATQHFNSVYNDMGPWRAAATAAGREAGRKDIGYIFGLALPPLLIGSFALFWDNSQGSSLFLTFLDKK